ncbi:MAG: hypothetical protein H6834_18195 [Planctomycetes bacterium]|nr:hypothetical protein [Planctomycetota bacterium]MCB9891519.1 hypothetical protein [Planctomycetota bacterium]
MIHRIAIALVCAAGAHGQSALEPGPDLLGQMRALRRTATALSDQDGEVWASGYAFKAHFVEGRATLYPRIGTLAETLRSVGLEFESVRRGEHLLEEARHAATPIVDVAQRTVTFARASCRERYDIRADGLEQSFVFPARPEGHGDLIVRLRLTTNLTVVPHVEGDGLDFMLGDHIAIHMATVTGFDADGRGAAGSYWFDGSHLELALPGAFVDKASYPLVLDPYFSPSLGTIAAGMSWEQSPDLAYDQTNDQFLYVWEEYFGGSDYDIRGMTSRTGMLFDIDVSTEVDREPCVANVDGSDQFVIVWEREASPTEHDLIGRTINAIGAWNGTSSFTVAGTTLDESEPQIAGDAAGGNIAYLVYNQGQNLIVLRPIQVLPNGQSSLLQPETVHAAPFLSYPVITKSGGPGRRYLVAAEDAVTSRVWTRAFDVTSGVVQWVSAVSPIPGATPQRRPSVDGDGTHFLLAYEVVRTGHSDVWIADQALPSNALGAMQWSWIRPLADTADDETYPMVARMGLRFGVVWQDALRGSPYRLTAADIDLRGSGVCGEICSSSMRIDVTRYPMCVASKYSGGAFREDWGLVLLQTNNAVTRSDIRAIQFGLVDGGTHQSPADWCGRYALASVACARSPYASYTQRLYQAELGSTAFLVISPARIDLRCGSCTLIPDPFVGYVWSVGPLTSETVEVATPIPAGLQGAVFYTQWILSGGSSPGCQGLSLSRAHRVTID